MRLRLLCALIGVTGLTAPRAAAQVAVQFDFNAQDTTASTNTTNATPALVLIGGTTAAFTTAAATNGASSTDPAAAASNFAYNTTNYPAQGAGSGTAGVLFGLPTTGVAAGFSDAVFRFDLRASNTASRFYEVQYTTDGTTFTSAGVFQAGAPDTFTTRTFDLSAVAAANNNPNFAVRAVAAFDPAAGAYTAASGAAAYATTGTVRYDVVTLSRGLRFSGAGGDLTAAANFSTGAAPTPTDTLLFGAAATTAVSPGGATFGQFVFQAGAPAYTVGAAGDAAVTLQSGVANLSAATQTFNAPVAFARSATVENVGTVVFNGPVNAGPTGGLTGLQLTGAGGTTVFNGTYTGNDLQLSGGHTVAGVGTITNEIHNYGGTVRGGQNGANNFGTLTVTPSGGDVEFYAGTGSRVPTLQIQATRTGPNAVQNSVLALTGGGGNDVELNDAGVGSNLLRFELLAADLNPTETYNLTVITTDSVGSIEFNNVASANGFVFPATSYEVVGAAGFSSLVTVVDVAGGSTLVLTLTPVPEPATVLLAAAAGLAGARAARRRVRRT